MQREFVSGAGLGLRRALLEPLGARRWGQVDFLEVAPRTGSASAAVSAASSAELTERLPFLCHGLSLNLGGCAPLDMSLLRAIKGFHRGGMTSVHHSEHLSALPTTANSTT